MPLSLELAKTSFAAGEVSPELRVRSDLAKQQTGLAALENMVVLLEGGVTRAPGTRMIMPYRDPNQWGAAIPFRFDGGASNAYLIFLNAGFIRFVTGNAVVQAPLGGIYEIAMPYLAADLGAADGVSRLRYASSGNVVFIFCDGYQPQVLTRLADNSWTLTPYLTPPPQFIPQGGGIAPVDTVNVDPTQTLLASGTLGSVLLTATAIGPVFDAGHVGSVWRLDESNLSLTAEWTANETINPAVVALAGTGVYVGGMTNPANAFDGSGVTFASQGGSPAQIFIGVQLAVASALVSATVAFGISPFSAPHPASQSMDFYLMGGNHAPVSPFDGTILASGSFANFAAVALNSNDAVTAWTYAWIAGVPHYDVGNSVNITTITLNGIAAATAPTLRRFSGNVYQAVSAGNSGANPPVHSSGTVLSGTGGVFWRYRARDRGFAQITAINSSQQAVANVLERLPDSVAVQPTISWWPSAWDGDKGWPNRVILFDQSIVAGRGDKFWKTQPGSFFNWDIVDPSSAQSGIAARLVAPSGSLARLEWFFVSSFLSAGTRDDEWILCGQNPFDAITVTNLQPFPSRHKGSAPHIPAYVDGAAIFIGRSRKRAHMATLEGGISPSVKEEELTISARHILGAKAMGVSHAQDPNCVNWFWLLDGSLVGNTLMAEQQINGWHRHPRTNCAVEWVVTIPSSDDGVSWTYFGTRRTINGQTARFVELLQPFFAPANPAAPDATGAWFVDCGLRYQGGPTQYVTGFDHLVGQRVAVHADGAMYHDPDGSLPLVDPNGGITLSRPTQDLIAGLPLSYRARLLPLDLTTPKGSTAGARQKANHVFLRVVNSAGGNIVINPDHGGFLEPLEQPGTLTYGAPVPLRTGIIRTPGLETGLADECVVEISGSDTMPFTLIGVDPDLIVAET